MWLEFLGQTEDETVLMREASMFVDVKLWGTEGWVCSASHRLSGEASTEHKAVGARRTEQEPCLLVAHSQPVGARGGAGSGCVLAWTLGRMQ